MKPKRLVHGVGVNDAGYVTQKMETIGYVNGRRRQKVAWICPYYRVWVNMLKRCYSTKTQERQPTYSGCTVSEEWIAFSNFKAWMVTQDWEGLHLDKDLLFEGNKLYSSGACVFVTQAVNNFTNDRCAARGEWLIGVCWDRESSKFQSNCRNPFTRKQEKLGYFTTEMEAHEAWLNRKLELARLLAAEQTDERVAKALIERYTNLGEAK